MFWLTTILTLAIMVLTIAVLTPLAVILWEYYFVTRKIKRMESLHDLGLDYYKRMFPWLGLFDKNGRLK